ncbi:MAG: hypothetical protein HYZ42_14520, partial [Bacteroidetes bacterium]|nr:hypothetical protein [Bacteroidota bacterium]
LGPLVSILKLNYESTSDDDDTGSPQQSHTSELAILELMVSEIRKTSYNLTSPEIEEIGLTKALENYCEMIQRFTIQKIRIFNNVIEDEFSDGVALNIYRIVQELVNNSIKYSHAKDVSIFLYKREGKLFAAVHDNGVGFDLQKIEEGGKGLGIQNVKNRIRVLEGDYKIRSDKTGTMVRMQFKMNKLLKK